MLVKGVEKCETEKVKETEKEELPLEMEARERKEKIAKQKKMELFKK